MRSTVGVQLLKMYVIILCQVLLLYFRVRMIFENSYNVVGLYRNDKMALLSRMDFVERNELRSNHIYDPSGTKFIYEVYIDLLLFS